jgi:hypothetical protein
MDIYLFVLLTIFLTLVACGIGFLLSTFVATRIHKKAIAAVFHFVVCVSLGIGAPSALWYATFRNEGTVQGSHNAGFLVPLTGLIVVIMAVAFAAKGASSIMQAPKES